MKLYKHQQDIIEIWKYIPGYENIYQVSNLGRVKSFYRKKKILKNINKKFDYKTVFLHKNKISKSYLVHRLVALTFLPNKEKKPDVNHKDNNPSNNRVDNLEWCTEKENTAHAMRQNRMYHALGVKNGEAKLNEKQVVEIKKSNEPSRVLAKKYGMEKTQILRIKKGVNWKHI